MYWLFCGEKRMSWHHPGLSSCLWPGGLRSMPWLRDSGMRSMPWELANLFHNNKYGQPIIVTCEKRQAEIDLCLLAKAFALCCIHTHHSWHYRYRPLCICSLEDIPSFQLIVLHNVPTRWTNWGYIGCIGRLTILQVSMDCTAPWLTEGYGVWCTVC